MSFTHMETFNFRVQRMLSFQTGEYDEYSYAPKWPSPFPSCTLEGTSQNTKMSLRWESAEPQIYVAEGNMKVVTSDSATVFNLDFAFGAFPPFPSGSVPYVHSAAQYWNRACTMTMSLVLLDYPFKTNHEDYAESFAGESRFFFVSCESELIDPSHSVNDLTRSERRLHSLPSYRSIPLVERNNSQKSFPLPLLSPLVRVLRRRTYLQGRWHVG